MKRKNDNCIRSWTIVSESGTGEIPEPDDVIEKEQPRVDNSYRLVLRFAGNGWERKSAFIKVDSDSLVDVENHC
jgi:hypothetical protein